MVKKTLWMVSIAALVSACSGLENKPANELDQDQRTEVCEDLQAYAADKISEEDGKKVACVIAGEAAAALDMSTTCEETRDACLAEPAETTANDDCSFAEETDCTASVGEIRDCLEAQIDQQAEFIAAFDCGATDAEIPDERPAECDVVEEQCPDFFDGS